MLKIQIFLSVDRSHEFQIGFIQFVEISKKGSQ